MILKTLTQEDGTVTYVLCPEIESEDILIKQMGSGIASINPNITTSLIQVDENQRKGFGILIKL
jgi:hypothetical protein